MKNAQTHFLALLSIIPKMFYECDHGNGVRHTRKEPNFDRNYVDQRSLTSQTYLDNDVIHIC